MPVTTLIRPDGSAIEVKAEDAGVLRTLGYRDRSPEEEHSALTHEAEGEYYRQPQQRLGTVIGGAASGLTLGLSDLALGDEADRQRANYNPGYRIGSELIGGLAAPVGMLGKAAEGLAEGKTAATALRYGAEGAQFGLGAEITSSQLSGDPLTIEGALAGVGWGGVFGGGLGAIVGKAGVKLEGAMAEREAIAQAARDGDALASRGIPDEQWGAFKGTIDDTRARVDAAAKEAEAVVQQAHDAFKAPMLTDEMLVPAEGARVEQAAQGPQGADFNLTPQDVTKLGEAFTLDVTNAGAAPRVRGELRAAQKELKTIKSAIKKGDDELTAYHVGEYSTHIKNIAELTSKPNPLIEAGGEFGAETKGRIPKNPRHAAPVETEAVAAREPHAKPVGLKEPGPVDHVGPVREPNTMPGAEFEGTAATHGIHPEPVLRPSEDELVTKATKAAEEYAQLQALSKRLSGFPHTPEGLAQAGKREIERMSAAIDETMKLPPEFAGVKQGLSLAVDGLVDAAGVKFAGTQGSKFRGVWETIRGSQRVAVRKEVEKLAKGKSSLWDKFGHNAKHFGVNSVAAEAAGFEHTPNLVYNTAKTIGWALLSIKGAAVGAITNSAVKYGPATLRAARLIAPRIEPLKRRLDGTLDTQSKGRAELMKARSREIYSSGFGVKDTLFRGVAPLAQFHPEFAQGLHAATVAQFQFLLDKLPKDPGHAFNALRSLWRADDVATEKFARYYEVFHDPVGVITRTLDKHQITVEAAEGLREMWPALFGELRSQMLMRLSNPKVRDSLSYNDQVHLGLLLDLPINSTMSGRFIASQQQMFTQRNQPSPMKPQVGADGGGGRPAGPGNSSMSSQAQKIEAH